jgi:AcrR family transcriptional regulator
MARHPTPGARQRILDTAGQLFNEEGVRAVGLQQVIDACGCGKSLLYREFPSKDDLVVAWLQQCRGTWDELVDGAIDDLEDDPEAQLVAIVAAVTEDVSVPGARGCALRNTHAEFPDPDHPAHQVAVEHVAAMRSQIHDIARRTTAADPDTLADRLMLVVDGVYSNGIVLGPRGAAPAAVAFAEDLVRSATREDARSAAQ